MSNLPDSGSKNSWTGWIPTVSGQLSFSIIGHSSAAANCTYLNGVPLHSDQAAPVRYIALHQRRIAPDFPYPDWIARRFFPGAEYDFLLIAQTAEAAIQLNLPRDASGEPRVDSTPNAQGVLTGSVFVLLHERDNVTRLKNVGFLQNFKNTVVLADREDLAEARKVLEAILRKAKSDKIPLFEFRFSLFRTGEIKFWLDDDAWNGLTAGGKKAEALLILPNQAFYFVKDVVHRHYHHDGSSDQMLSVTRSVGQHAGAEIEWRRSTLWGLVRVVMQYRRTGRWPDLQKAKGVAAYAEAFQHSFATCRRSDADREKFEPSNDLGTYDFKHIRESINVSAEESAARRGANWQAITLGVTIVLAVLIAWSSYGGKLLTIGLSACQAGKSSELWRNFRGEVDCGGLLAHSVSQWERFAHDQPLATMLVFGLVLVMLYNPVLRDTPLAKSWFGIRWQSFRSTLLLLAFAVHVNLTRGVQPTRWLVFWLREQIVPLILGLLLIAEFAWLLVLLRALI